MRIVLDTNVLVSGLISTGGKPAAVLDLVIDGKVRPLLDERIFAEYMDVIFRPRFRIASSLASEVLALLDQQGEWIAAVPLAGPLPDPDDRPFLEVAVSGSADALVTGNLKHYPQRHGMRVVDPASFLRIWEDR